VQTYSSPLSEFLNLFQGYKVTPLSNQTSVNEWVTSIREKCHTFLMPFLQYPYKQSEGVVWARNSDLFRETCSRCRFQYTRLLDPEEGYILSPEESNLKWAVEETTGSICNVLIDIGFSVEGMWQRQFNTMSDTEHLREVSKEVKRWTEGVEELMAWLGWASDWIWCEEQCKWDEKCFIPMWPLIPIRGWPPRSPYNHTRPGYDSHKVLEFDGSARNRTHRLRPGGDWSIFEDTLWKPKCVKSDYLSHSAGFVDPEI